MDRVARSGRNGIGTIRPLIEERVGWNALTESHLEDLFRRIVSRTSLPMPIEQVRVFNELREVCRADFAYPDHRIAIELDSEKWHMDRDTFERDRLKQNELHALGWRVYRFTWRQLQDNPVMVISTLATALSRQNGQEGGARRGTRRWFGASLVVDKQGEHVRIAIGSDHAGFELKTELIGHLDASGHTVQDLGTDSTEPVDYPDFAASVAREVVHGKAERGIVVCGSGAGASIAANKITGARSAVVHDHYTAHQAVEHDDMNVLAIGARVIGTNTATEIVDAFIGAQFSGEERHMRRLRKVVELDRNRG
jgi:ribose 5-phosphate isomerase B